MTDFKVGDVVRPNLDYLDNGYYISDMRGVISEVVRPSHNGWRYTMYRIEEPPMNGLFCANELTLAEDDTPMRYPFTATSDRISIFFENKMHSVSRGDVSFEALLDHLKEPHHDADTIRDCLDKPTMISKITEGLVAVEGDEVLYDGEPIHSTLTTKLLRMLEDGFDIRPWARFLEKVMCNPSYRSRESLFNFLEHFETPITEDGDFLAFKRVRGDFMDIHSGTMDNSPGKVVEMPRYKVDDDSQRTCSAGLHACASSYLGSFYARTDGYKVVVVKINPRDVVAVPYDYQFSKMRVCRYKVISEADEAKVDTISNSSYYDEPEYDDYDGFCV